MASQSYLNQEFGGERPLFGAHDLILEGVVFEVGESPLKECTDVVAKNCRFLGKYPFWHNHHVLIEDSLFTELSRAAIWYSSDLTMKRTLVEAPKMFREMDGLVLEDVNLPNAQECCWNCRQVDIKNVKVENGDYFMTNGCNIKAENLELHGNYSFQYTENVEIRNSHIYSKDAFWNSLNVTVYDSWLEGEYLAWHSHNLRLVNCHISGTQSLCYAHNLTLENCTFAEDADRLFEYSELHAKINGHLTSIVNPRTGTIECGSVGQIVIDKFCKEPGDCLITQSDLKSVQ